MALTPNFPTPPQRSGGGSMTFPEDLISSAGDRKYYTSISFVEYDMSILGGFNMSFGGGLKLPMPRKLNDNEILLWEEWNGGAKALAAAEGVVGGALGAGAGKVLGGRIGMGLGMLGSPAIAGALSAGIDLAQISTGKTINPFMFMMFKRPSFKEHTLQWTLAPRSQKESDTLKDIIKECKRSALPPKPSGLLMDYPKIAMVQLFAGKGKDQYLYKFKPCAVISVQVDYSATGLPAFFESGAPVAVNLTLNLKEIELWFQDDPDL